MNEIELLQLLEYLIYFFFEQSRHDAKARGTTPANKWYIFKNYLPEKSFCWYAEAAARIFILFKERQLSQIFSEAEVQKHSLKQLL